MTTLLEDAFELASSLPESEQNVYAKIFIEEISSEKRWDSAFSQSEELLAQMADEALAELNDHKTTLLHQDKL